MTFTYVLLSCLILMAKCASCQLLRYAEQSLIPDDESLLTDYVPDTCAIFNINADARVPIISHFRIQLPSVNGNPINVSLIGNNINCGRYFYVTSLSPAETETWTGRWSTCTLIEKSLSENDENCLYMCQCSGCCEEIQIIRQPTSVEDSYWSLCEISLKFTTVINQCSKRAATGVYKATVGTNDCEYRDIYCDMETDGGGWTVLLRRVDGSENFNRDWQDYKQGFGSLNGEFWAGNELINRLTNDGRGYTLRVDMTSYEGEKRFAKYTRFIIHGEEAKYPLYVDGYDNRSTLPNSLWTHRACKFSTGNADNDGSSSRNLATEFQSGWWYCEKDDVILTGLYGNLSEISSGSGIQWKGAWPTKRYAKYVVMMIHPN
ncbi:hypothetical protein LSH36_626g01004 [Paralvinella palmiformis]|uniref:Fibrinogen C-terminal domain-containing protein n=1 Tax=Paralvinella palmiformis TaxID=53620 RepID=A0AAD9J4D8_9ANNE|nr:hypothetical protein LSH36_626g01004 [Paralvinella palmiformis]